MRHCCTTFAGNVVGAMSAPQRDGIRGAVCCLNLFSVSVFVVFESRASEANTCELLVCIGHRRSWTPRALPSVLWAPCCSVHTRVTLLGAHESTVSCVPVFCVLPAFRACVSSRVTVCCSNLQFILAVPEDGTQMCKVAACASICRVGSLPTPFSRACVVCGF